MRAGVPASLTAIALPLFFGPLAFGAVEPWAEGLLVAMVLCAAAVSASGESRPLDKDSAPLFAAFLAIAALSLVQCSRAGTTLGPSSLLPFSADAPASLRAFLLWAAYAAAFWIICRLPRNRGYDELLAWGFLTLGATIAVVGLVQRTSGNTAFYGLRPIPPRSNPFGPYTNSNHAANLLAISSLMGIGLAAFKASQIRRDDGVGSLADSFAQMVILLLLLSVNIFALFSTRSRGALLSFAAAVWTASWFCASFARTRPSTRNLRLLLVLALLLITGWVFLGQGVIWQAVNSPDTSTLFRFSMFRSGAMIFRDFPVFGIGVESVAAVFPAYQERIVEGFVTHLHNDWLELFVGAGLVGGGAFATALAWFIFNSTRAWVASSTRERRWLGAGAFAASFSFILHGLTDFASHIPANAVIFSTLLGIFARLAHGDSREPGLEGTADASPFSRGALLASLSLVPFALRPLGGLRVERAAAHANPAARTHYLSLAATRERTPAAAFNLGLHYLKLSDDHPEGRTELLRDSLGQARIALAAKPLNPYFLRLAATDLWRLERKEDTRPLVAPYQGIGF